MPIHMQWTCYSLNLNIIFVAVEFVNKTGPRMLPPPQSSWTIDAHGYINSTPVGDQMI